MHSTYLQEHVSIPEASQPPWISDAQMRQDVLETLDVPERIQKLTAHVAAVLGQLEAQTNTGRSTLQ